MNQRITAVEGGTSPIPPPRAGPVHEPTVGHWIRAGQKSPDASGVEHFVPTTVKQVPAKITHILEFPVQIANLVGLAHWATTVKVLASRLSAAACATVAHWQEVWSGMAPMAKLTNAFDGIIYSAFALVVDFANCVGTTRLIQDLSKSRISLQAMDAATTALADLFELVGKDQPDKEQLVAAAKRFTTNWEKIDPNFQKLLPSTIREFAASIKTYKAEEAETSTLHSKLVGPAVPGQSPTHGPVLANWNQTVLPRLKALHSVRRAIKGSGYKAAFDSYRHTFSFVSNAGFTIGSVAKQSTLLNLMSSATFDWWCKSFILYIGGGFLGAGAGVSLIAYNAYTLKKSLHTERNLVTLRQEREIEKKAAASAETTDPGREKVTKTIDHAITSIIGKIGRSKWRRLYWAMFGLGLLVGSAGLVLAGVGPAALVLSFAFSKLGFGLVGIQMGSLLLKKLIYEPLRAIYRQYNPSVEDLFRYTIRSVEPEPKTWWGRFVREHMMRIRGTPDATAVAAMLKEAIKKGRYNKREHTEEEMSLIAQDLTSPVGDRARAKLQATLLRHAVNYMEKEPEFMALRLMSFLVSGQTGSADEARRLLTTGLEIKQAMVENVVTAYSESQAAAQEALSELATPISIENLTEAEKETFAKLQKIAIALRDQAQARRPEDGIIVPIEFPPKWQAEWDKIPKSQTNLRAAADRLFAVLDRLEQAEKSRQDSVKALAQLIKDQI